LKVANVLGDPNYQNYGFGVYNGVQCNINKCESGYCAGGPILCVGANVALGTFFRFAGPTNGQFMLCSSAGILTAYGCSFIVVGNQSVAQTCRCGYGFIQINAGTCPWSGGTVAGQRYLGQQNGVIQTLGGGANYFPGNVAGSLDTGGQYT